ncbi:MAG: hypothetical protein JOY58_16390 [Solirubrobacterales bacterium]|nr:hypothetical protein [Solirubrobacterales bacterium]
MAALWLALGSVPSATPRAAARTPGDGSASSAAARSPRAEVTIVPGQVSRPISASFLGLSTEYWSLPLYERHLRAFERVLAMLHVPGDRPLILRIGGDSADWTYWDPRARTFPRQFFELTPAWLREAATLVRRSGTRVILDLNLAAGSPTMAARWARAALAELPRRSLVGFEIGNEPDLYHQELFDRLNAIAASPFASGDYSAATYARDFSSYAGALSPVVRGVPLLGPAVANPALDVGWLSSLVARDHRQLGMLTAHRYPLSACKPPGSPQYPTVARVLSERSSAGLAESVKAAVALAHHAGLDFRLTELNSVTCGGRQGVSNTFATALWAPDALFELAQAGVDGVNLHIRVNAINAPFSLCGRSLRARPLLYGLIMFARALGPDARLVAVHLREARSLHLKVWGVRVAGDALHLLVINKGPRTANLDLRVAGSSPATVQRLLAPSASAQSGVTLAGQQLGPDAVWEGARTVQMTRAEPDGYHLTVPGSSEALVEFGPSATAR